MALCKEQIQNSDCKRCTYCSHPPGKDCCFAGCTNQLLILVTEFDTVDKKNNDFCCTCFCTLLCFGPKFAISLPWWPFTWYNVLRNKCSGTKNVNYIC
jgi:hypothetical protein